MRKFISIIFIVLLYTGIGFSQSRVTISEWASGPQFIFGSVSSAGVITGDSLQGGVSVDTLRAMVPVGGSHYFNLFLKVSVGTLTAGIDSAGFKVMYAIHYDSNIAAVSTASNFNYWEIGDTGPKLVKTWVVADSSNNGQHYVRFNSGSTALPVNAIAEILLVSTAENDTCTVAGIMYKGK